MVHAPIGGVTIATVCDVVSAVGANQTWARTWFKGGSYALIVGTAILFVAIATGVIERNRRTLPATRERRAVNKHAIVMSAMGVVCVIDLILRNNHFSNAQHTPLVVLVMTLVALGLTVMGGEIGGRLVYRLGLGVASPPAPAMASPPAPAMAGGTEPSHLPTTVGGGTPAADRHR